MTILSQNTCLGIVHTYHDILFYSAIWSGSTLGRFKYYWRAWRIDPEYSSLPFYCHCILPDMSDIPS